ncbi:MAG: PKD domain-containing protein [Bacteroidota bacterium]
MLLSIGSVYGQVNFSASQQIGCIPFNVQFENLTPGATNCTWRFTETSTGITSTIDSTFNPSKSFIAPGHYDVKLIVNYSNGTIDSLTRNTFITAKSAPQPSFSAPVLSACFQNNQISFINSTSATYDSLLWDFGDGTTSNVSNPVHGYTASGYFNVTLIVYANGCSNALTRNSYINILNNPPTAFFADTLVTCNASQPISFTSQTVGTSNYIWNFGDGTSSTQANPQHTYAGPGVYDVTLITINSLGCRDTAFMPAYINVLNNPVPVISVSGGLNRCVPVYATFSTTTSNIQSWTWNVGSNTFSTPSFQQNYFAPGAYPVTLTANYTNGCTNNKTVVLNARPLDIAYFTASTYNGCAPVTIALSHQTTSSNLTYSWQLGNGTTSTTGPNVNVTYNSPGTYLPSLTVTNSFGCSNTAYAPNPITVTTVDAQFTADDINGCPPHAVNFSHPGGAGYSYLWNFGDGRSSTQQNPSHTYVNPGTYPVSLTVTNQSGCMHTYSMPSPVEINNGVNNFVPGDTIYGCAPFTANLYDNSSSSSSWLWSFGDGATSTSANAIHTYNQAGVYNVTLQTQSNGSSCSQFVNPFITYVLTEGEANFSVTNTLCPPYTSTFIDSSINAVSWLWDFGDGTTSTLQNPSHVYTNGGSYNVSLTITTSAGCTYTMVQNFAANFNPLNASPTGFVVTLNPPTVQFNANSTGATGWLWNFGDGTTSSLQNPLHVYPTSGGPFPLSLIIFNNGCADTLSFAPPASSGPPIGSPIDPPVGPPGGGPINTPDPIAGCAPFNMGFNNPVQGAISSVWHFGDGNTSSLNNPDHIYTAAGLYTVTLITVNSAGSTDTLQWLNAVRVNAVSADFNYTSSSGCTGSTITLNNNSTTGATYSWAFGDGTQSSLFEPTHQYGLSGMNHLITLNVTDSMGCSASKSITYYASGTNPISASKKKVCKNEPISFYNNNPGYATYLWDFGDGNTSSLPNPVHSYTAGGVFNVVLTVMDVAQCTTVFNMPYPIEIYAPNADFSFALIPASCNSPSVNFTNLSTGATSYLWDFGNGLMSSAVSPSITLNAYGSHNVTLIAASGSCADTMTLTGYAVRPNIIANFSYTQDRICFPITITLTNTSIDGSTYLWDFGDGTTSTTTDSVFTHVFMSQPQNPITLSAWNSLGCLNVASKPNIQSMQVSFSVVDSIGCAPFAFQVGGTSNINSSWYFNFGNGLTSSIANSQHANASTVFNHNGSYVVNAIVTAPTGCVQRFDSLVTVSATGPAASFNLMADSSCAPTIVTFQDGSFGAQSWFWTFGNGNQSALQNPTHVYNVPGTYDITLVVTDSSGCTDTLTQTDAVQITGTYSHFTSTDPTGCAPWTVAFSDSSVNASTWLWDFGDGNSSSDPNPVHTYTQPGVYAVILITYDSSGCSSAYQLPDSIRVSEIPEALFTVSGTSGCAPYLVTFSNQSTGAVSYDWDFGDGSHSNSVNTSHSYASSGTYWVTLIANSLNGCSDTFTYQMPVVVGEIPLGNIIASATSGCAPLNVVFTSNISNADSTALYSWNYNGNNYGGSNLNLTFAQNGTHQVQLSVTNQAGCSATFSATATTHGADTLGPVVMRSASVLGPNNVELKWADIIDPELAYYRIYRMDNSTGNFNLIHTSYSIIPVNPDVYQAWVDHATTTSSKTNTYLVQAVNTCGLAAPLNAHTPHTTVNLEVNTASSTPTLQWNSYGGASTSGYLVQRMDEPNAPWTNLTVVPATVNMYVDSSVYCSDSVSYRITALDLNGMPIFDAFSDIENILAPGSLLIQRVDMVRSTVEDDSWVLTEWSMPTLAPQLVTGFELFRSTDNINFTRIAVLPPVQTSYEDRNVSVKSQEYYYRVKVSNTCSLEASSGYESSSILLLANPDQRYGVNLRWTPYVNWDTGVEEYVIEEWNQTTGTWDYVKKVDGSTTETGVQ